MKKKVLVTGASGFLGSHVADMLSEKGYSVKLFDMTPSPYKKEDQEMVIGNILDVEKMNEALKNVDYVFHFAGIADIDECLKKPVDTVQNNILGTTLLLEQAIKHKIKRFIFASTTYVYSDAGYFYKISKQACENIIETYGEIHDLKYTILRYGSLYGERSNDKNSIYKLLKQAVLNKKITYYGTGEELREFIHIHDAAEMTVKCLDNEFENSRLIISGGEKYRYKDLLEMIKEIMQNKIDVEIKPSNRRSHYKITPYNFNPKIAKKLTANSSFELGQGILNLIKEIYQESQHE